MQPVGPSASHVDTRVVGDGGAFSAVQRAFRSLLDGARGRRLSPNGPEGLRLPDAARAAWLGGLAEALAEVPLLTLGIAPGAISFGDTPVSDGPTGRVVADGLYAAGARGLMIFAGAPDDELLQLARILLTAWPAAMEGELEAAVWGLDLAWVHLELIGAAEAGVEADLRPPGRLRVSPESLDRAPEGGVQVGTLDDEALAALRRLRDSAPPEPAALLTVSPTPGRVPAELVAQAGAAQAGELDPAALAGVVAGLLQGARSPEDATRAALFALRYALGLLGGPDSPGPLLHALLAFVDPDLNPDHPQREAVGAAVQALSQPALRDRLVRAVADAPETALRGELFSLFSLLANEDAVRDLSEHLPRAAARILGDALLVREQDAGAIVEMVRRRLAGPALPTVLLGLAMASRCDDARLAEPVLAQSEHPEAAVREAVLYALRRQRNPRVRELMRKRLDDPSPEVRVEALRNCVAWRDPEVAKTLAARLQDPAVGERPEVELRALCLAFGKLQKERAVPLLVELAEGRAGSGVLPRYALLGLRAVGTSRARDALQDLAVRVPGLMDEARSLTPGEDP